MRLHRLELSGVGPFRDRQEVDFDELAESGLFLIDGATGSGKTTIIDAIVYALFGVMSGPDSDAARIRSSYCSGEDPTGVACEFSVNDRRHRITRVPAHCRDPWDPTRAATSKPVRQTLTEYASDGSPIRVLTASREIDQHVEHLLGMTAEQFRQLVVLPQGQFAELLRKTPVERLNSLAPLLGDEFFAQIQDDLRAQGEEAQRRRSAARDAAQATAQQLAGRLTAHLDGDGPAPEVDFTSSQASDDDRLAAVATILRDLEQQARRAALAREAQEARTRATREEARLAGETAEALRQVGLARQAVARAEGALDAEDHGVPAAEIDARIATVSKLEGALAAPAAWEAEAADRLVARDALMIRRSECTAEADLLRAEQRTVPTSRKGLQARLATAQRLAGTLDSCLREEARLDDLHERARERARLTPVLADLTSALARAKQEQADSDEATRRADLAWASLVEQQRSSRAAELARGLRDRAPCPVCGAVEHPSPAHPSSGSVLVSDGEVEAAKDATSTARNLARRAGERSDAARARWQECANLVVALEGALDGQSQNDVASLHEAARAATSAARQAVASLAEINGELELLSERERSLGIEIGDLDRESASIAATIAAGDEAEREGLARIRALIGPAGSAAELLAATQARVAALSALRAAQAELATASAAVPATRRDLDLIDAVEQATRSEEALAAESATLADITEASTGLAAVVSEAAPLSEAFSAALAARRDLEAGTQTAVGLAALVTASNPKRLQLRSYALQRRFESVLAAASIHLERMSSGKFTFELSDETARAGQSGLGIALHDTWTGHRQDPKSLSGGETFYASLSLALGLADVVRGEAGGSALETLFVDEGFGSLDQATLYQVLDQLDQLRSGRRAVGVVSHVTEMRESIPDRIEVRRQADSTSTIVRPSAPAA